MSTDRQKTTEKTSSSQQVEIAQELVDVWRTYKVRKGGRQPSFNALIVAGDGNGKVGFGRGKAAEVPAAIQKAVEQATR